MQGGFAVLPPIEPQAHATELAPRARALPSVSLRLGGALHAEFVQAAAGAGDVGEWRVYLAEGDAWDGMLLTTQCLLDERMRVLSECRGAWRLRPDGEEWVLG